MVAEDKTFEKEAKKSDAEVVVPASKEGVSKKVKLDPEVDTSVKDLGPNPMQKLFIWQRQLTVGESFQEYSFTYIVLLYKCVIWFMV